jgi:hypothetical protein
VVLASVELGAIDSTHRRRVPVSEPSARRQCGAIARVIPRTAGRVRVTAGAAVMVVLLALVGVAGGQGTAVISAELIEAAASRGSVRVVVRIEVSAGADAAAIGAAKQTLWGDLSGTTYRIVRDPPGAPHSRH